MQRLEAALTRLAGRGEALPTDVLLERLDRGLRGTGGGVVIPLPDRHAPLRRRPGRWSGPVIAAAACVAVIAAGLAFWLATSVLGGGAATAPTTAVATTPVPVATTGTSATSRPGDPAAAALGLVPTVERALQAGDLDLLPLHPDAAFELSGIGLWFAAPDAMAPVAAAREQMAEMLAWERRLGAWFALSGCVLHDGSAEVQVDCTVEYGNDLMDRAGITGHGAVVIDVADGRITRLADHRDAGAFLDLYEAKWMTFVLRDHPGDASRMFTESGRPILTLESAELHAALLEEWARSWGL